MSLPHRIKGAASTEVINHEQRYRGYIKEGFALL